MPYKDLGKQREYQRKWMAERRRKWIEANGPCANCGDTNDLQVDHIDPGGKVGHRVWSWSKERLEAELLKCQVLCRPCHQDKTDAQLYRPKRHHGTTTMYRRGCRCRSCKDAHTAYYREWRAKK